MEKLPAPSERWKKLKTAHPDPRLVKSVKPVMEEIGSIDRATHWQETEPQWWLEMMEYSRHLKTTR